MKDARLQDLEFDRLIEAGEAIERALAARLVDWMGDPWRAPVDRGGLCWREHPIWWWRVKLISWAGSLSTRAQHRSEDLRAFTMHAKNVNDAGLREFLERVADDQEQAVRSA